MLTFTIDITFCIPEYALYTQEIRAGKESDVESPERAREEGNPE